MLGERVAYCQNHIGLKKRLCCAGMTTVSKNSQRQGVIFRNNPFAVERGDKGDLEPFDKRTHLSVGIAANSAVSEKTYYFFLFADRVREHGSSTRNLAVVRQHGLDV